jgi:hypothetical protein
MDNMTNKDDVIRGQEWAGMALVHESERLRGLLEHAEEVNGELTVEREELRAQNERLRLLLWRLYEWDHMASAADGPYWRSEIEKALGKEC